VDGHRPGTGRPGAAVQDVQPGHAVRAARVRVRVERGAGPGTGAVGTARGVQVRQDAPGQDPARRRSRLGTRCRCGRERPSRWRRPGHSDTDLVAGPRPAGRAHGPPRVLRQRAAAPPAEGRRAQAPVPGRAPEAVRVRGRRPGRHVHAGHGVPAGQGVRQDVHVHHHAGHGAREAEPVARGQCQGADDRRRPRERHHSCR